MISPSIRLRRAIHLNDLILAQRIIRSNPQVLRNPDLSDRANTSLHLAASLGAVDIAEFLIEAGHEDERVSRNTDGATPLMEAVEKGHEVVAQLIAAHFPHCIGWQDKGGMDVVMKAARHGSASLITAFLSLVESTEELSEATDKEGSTALHFASANGHLKCVRTLLQAGADPHASNNFSWAPVSYSSTVQAEVYFRSLVAELEKKRGEQRELQLEMDRRREGGVRIVGSDDDLDLGREAAREILAKTDAGRITPTGVRAQGWGLSGRIRAGSTD